jgi:hypothetical protein
MRLTQKTGLTSKTKTGYEIPADRSPIPGMARIFNAIPGVENTDFLPEYRQMLVRQDPRGVR